MSARIITAIAFKVFALYFLVQVVLQIPSILSIYEALGPWRHPDKIVSFAPYLVVGVVTLVGFVTAYIIHKLGNSVLEAMPDSSSSSEAAKLEAVLFQLLGVYFVVTALTYLPANIILSIFDKMSEHNRSSFLALWFTVAANFIKLIFGCALIAKAPVWQALFYKLRQLGSQPYN